MSRSGDRDQGVSLVELLIAMALTLVLGSILATGVTGANKLFRLTSDESVGQTDVRTTIERLGRDVRNARSLDAGASASQLVLWIDSNSDYVKQSTEVVTWSLVPRVGDANHFDVARQEAGITTRTARFVISNLAFTYRTQQGNPDLSMPLTQVQADGVTLVSSDIQYARDATRALAGRHTVFVERLRNVP